MENYSAIHQVKIAQVQGFTVDNVASKFTTQVPQAFNFGAQVAIFFLATIMAITFVQYLLNRD